MKRRRRRMPRSDKRKKMYGSKKREREGGSRGGYALAER